MNTTENQTEKINLEEFERNLQKQEEFYEQYCMSLRHKKYHYQREPLFEENSHFPFTDNSGFWDRYWEFRALVASLRQNPDTKDDEDFIRLCKYWQSIGDPSKLSKDKFVWMKERYDSLLNKPSFKNNPFFRDILGCFLKSVYQLFTDPYYWDGFFDLD